MTCDILVIAPHPDDAELHLGATIAALTRQGAVVHLLDCTRGESASRGTPEIRAQEAAAAAKILGAEVRENLGLPDGGLSAADGDQRRSLVDAIRRHAPRWVLAMYHEARHPDHHACYQLSKDAVKSAAIHGYACPSGAPRHRCRIAYYEAELPAVPSLLFQASEADAQRKAEALACYQSQWGGGEGPQTAISQPAFLQWIEHRGRAWGYHADAAYAEALLSDGPWAFQPFITSQQN